MNNPFYQKALEYIETHDLNTLDNGKYIIDGDNLWVTIMDCEMREEDKSLLEVHNDYIDIQIPLSKSERFGIRKRHTCLEPIGEFDKEKDILFFNDSFEEIITVAKDEVVTFLPEDAHAPLIGEGVIHKAVFKVKVL